MKKRILLPIIGICIAAIRLSAQDTLPRFSLINAGNNRVIIGWVNKLENVKQISIQRSFDSLSGYKSILTVADPSSEQNGFMDAKAPSDRMFYRIYIMQDKGRYQFTAAKRPVKDTLRITRTSVPVTDPVSVPQTAPPADPVPLDTAEKAKPVVIQLNGFPGTADTVAVPVPVTLKKKPNAFEPSLYVFTCSDGYVCVRLPETEKPKKYSIKFFEKEIQLFELKELKTGEFKIDKANFYHAGWFGFELYEDGKLLEKHKFYLEKDF
ncbi:MAG: hypothetical protein ACO25B_04970 [Chitinophagaceae bacterium]